MNELGKLVRIARQRSLQKAAVVVGAPLSSHTVRSDIAANGPLITTPNQLTVGEFGDQGNMRRWLKELVTPARQKATLAHMAGRKSVQRRTP
jgi:hypothetical protein